MLLSMTGFGRTQTKYEDKVITIELRSLNSKFTDVKMKLPVNYRGKEAEFRQILLDVVKRGKIECTIDIQTGSGDSEIGINTTLFKKYYRQLSGLATELDMGEDGILAAILRIPAVIGTPSDDIAEEEFATTLKALHQTIEAFNQFRNDEGASILRDFQERTSIISGLLEQVSPHEKTRIETLRQRMKQHLDDFVGKENVDKNRFEQEVIYYLEKFDVNEEKVRLKQHLLYFDEQLNSDVDIKGRKLGFITQEMGREINTLGAKAYSSDIQQIVVQMKDELEKIKEQVANVV